MEWGRWVKFQFPLYVMLEVFKAGWVGLDKNVNLSFDVLCGNLNMDISLILETVQVLSLFVLFLSRLFFSRQATF